MIARLNVGGAATHVIAISDALAGRGYNVRLLIGSLADGEASFEYLARERRVQTIRIPAMSRRISLLKDVCVLVDMVRFLRRWRPMIIHTHTAKAGTLGRLAAWLTGVPIRVHTFHGHVFRGYYSSLASWFFVHVERWLARRTDCILALSDSQKHELCDVYRIAPRIKIAVVPLGLNLDPYLSVNGRSGMLRNSQDRDIALVGWIGRLTAVKAPSRFLESIPLVSAAVPRARFVMVGDGELRSACERQILEQGVGNRVLLLGWRYDLPPLYADLDLVVLSSINEGTPITLLEAMASGKPVVSTAVGGVPDLMRGPGKHLDGMTVFENGILVEGVAGLSQAICYLLQHPEQRQRMGQAGRDFVRTRFSEQRLMRDLDDLYRSLLLNKGLLPVSIVGKVPEAHEAFALSTHADCP